MYQIELITILETSIARFPSSEKSIQAAESDVYSTFSFFASAVSSGNLTRFVNKRCRILGCDRVIDIEPLTCEILMLMRPKLRDRNVIAAKPRPFY